MFSLVRPSTVNKARIVSIYKRSFSNGSALTKYEESDAIAFITLNNPAKRNALSLSMLTELREQFTRVDQNEAIRVVILKASGNVFSSGHDLKEINEKKGDRSFYENLFGTCTQVMNSIRTLSKPVIASVNGLATAAGCQLVSTCDLVVATDKSSFATPGVKIGLFCSTPGVAVVRAMNSTKKTMEMLLTGEAISAQEALQYGLLNKIVKEEELEAKTLELAKKIAKAPPEVVALGKRAFYKQIVMPVHEAYQNTENVMVDNVFEPSCTEGISAFVEKRHPNWK